MDVGAWLRNLGLGQYEASFRENDVNMKDLCHLTAEDLQDLGVVAIGHRRRLLVAIEALRLESRPADAPISSSPGQSAEPGQSADPIGQLGTSETTAERRPLSVMFCDLIGSTALSSRLDPEDLRDVIRAYQACVATTIQRFNGFIARYVGDGVLIYFGWPQAHETDAERAVSAGLAVAAAISKTQVIGEPLLVHIGIATGLVVVGEPIGSGDSRQQTAIGDTPNRAARLESLAGPGQVVIDAATRRQIGGLFECRDLGKVTLKGLSEPVPAWQVVSENRALGQFEALRSGLTPLVGRQEEMELLLRRWTQAKSGSGRVVLISAEPGVGKSRLVEALAERIAAEAHIRLRYFCSPHHQDSALYPVIARMERAAGFAHGDTPEIRLRKLESLLTAAELSPEDVALMAELHGLPSADLAPSFYLTPQQRNERTFAALLRQLEGLAQQQPMLIVFDDIHWIDPSSRELLDRLIEWVTDWPVLLLVLFRPEFQPPWVGQPQVTALILARLDRGDTAAMVASVASLAGDTDTTLLPPEIVAEITERTDGVPLFIEELTKAVLEAGVQGPAALSTGPRPGLSVPATLHASLMARLDRLGPPAREVAQAGAAIGREFGHALLAWVADLTEPQLREALDRLVNAGLVFVRGTPPAASYLFKHVLVQDAAYGSLLRSRRQGLHRRIAETLEQRFPEVVQAQPALLAQHCHEARQAEQAVTYWLKAGQQSLSRSAMAEAVAQLRKGLDVLGGLPNSPWRQHRKLDLQVLLGTALTARLGWTAAEVNETFEQARSLAMQLERPECLVPLLSNRAAFHNGRAEFRSVLPLCAQLAKIGEARNDVTAQVLGCNSQGIALFLLGELAAARAVLEKGIARIEASHCLVAGLSLDPYPVMLVFLGAILALQGHIDQARSRIDKAVSEARRNRHVHTLAAVLAQAEWFDWLTTSSPVHAEELLALVTEHRFQYWWNWAMVFRGRSLAALGRAREAVEFITQGLVGLRTTEAFACMPNLFTWLAQAHAALGQTAEVQKCLTEAAKQVEATDERVVEAEVLHRVPGDLLNAVGDQSGAERHYQQAIAIAERQGAKLLQLRASTSLARLWRDQGRSAEARELLGPIYGWFTEGFDAPILKAAKAPLDELE